MTQLFFLLTDREYYEKFDNVVNVQTYVEVPQLYILARCKSDDQQLMYGEERLEHILKLQEQISAESGIIVKDIICIFKGDKPAFQLEAGWLCGINATWVPNMYHAFNLPIYSLSDRINKTLNTAPSREYTKKYPSCTKSYENVISLRSSTVEE